MSDSMALAGLETLLKARAAFETCWNCGGSGCGERNYVTADMASDAGEPEMVGMELPPDRCDQCHGEGHIPDERVDALIAAVDASAYARGRAERDTTEAENQRLKAELAVREHLVAEDTRNLLTHTVEMYKLQKRAEAAEAHLLTTEAAAFKAGWLGGIDHADSWGDLSGLTVDHALAAYRQSKAGSVK